MNKTQIEWVKNPDGSQGYTLNPASGCRNHTPEGLCLDGLFPCYAYRLANGRLKSRYLANTHLAPHIPKDTAILPTDPFYPRFWEERLYHPWAGKPKGIFVCDMGDLFGIGIPEDWTRKVIDLARLHTENRYYLLTKQPQNLIKWSPFPENCYVGVTVCNADMFLPATDALDSIEATTRYISFEPLLENPSEFCEQWSEDLGATLDWLIIGACTGSWRDMVALSAKYPELAITKWNKKWVALPRIEWVQEIVEAADKAGIPVFLKDNLMPLFKRGDIWAIPEWASFNDWSKQEIGTTLRQEMPKGENATDIRRSHQI